MESSNELPWNEGLNSEVKKATVLFVSSGLRMLDSCWTGKVLFLSNIPEKEKKKKKKPSSAQLNLSAGQVCASVLASVVRMRPASAPHSRAVTQQDPTRNGGLEICSSRSTSK